MAVGSPTRGCTGYCVCRGDNLPASLALLANPQPGLSWYKEHSWAATGWAGYAGCQSRCRIRVTNPDSLPDPAYIVPSLHYASGQTSGKVRAWKHADLDIKTECKASVNKLYSLWTHAFFQQQQISWIFGCPGHNVFVSWTKDFG